MMKEQIEKITVKALHDLPTSGFVRQRQLIGPGNPLPISKSTLWKWIADGHFPAPVKLSQKMSAWKVEEVHAFFAARTGEVRQ